MTLHLFNIFITRLIGKELRKEYKDRGIDVNKLKGDPYIEFENEEKLRLKEFSLFLFNLWKEQSFNDLI